MRAVLAAVLVASSLLAGCIGGGDEGGDEVVTKARATVTTSRGGLEGVVTDAAVQPVAGANVTLVELERTVSALADGSYAFSEVPPGTYTVSAAARDYVSASETVVIVAGQVAALDFVLVHLFTNEPFIQQWEFAGFFECGLGVGWNFSALPAPPDNPAGDPRVFGLSTRPCTTVNGVVGGNTTNDKSDHFWELEAPVETFLFESEWDAGPGSMSSRLWIDVVINPIHCPNYCNWSILDMNGTSPLVTRIDRERFESIDDYFIAACDDGDDTRCGFDFWDKGWPLWSRVYPRWECQELPVQGCVPFQQEYRHYVSAFFNAPAPEAYSAVGGAG